MLKQSAVNLKLKPASNQRVNNLCGPCNEHITELENYFNVTIHHQENKFKIMGDASGPLKVRKILENLYEKSSSPISLKDVYQTMNDSPTEIEKIVTRKKSLMGKSKTQNQFIKRLNQYPLNFSIGPAGTGKTYLSVAKAVEAFENAKMDRIVFVRPAVEAGEKLGFLPGDMTEKVLPYLRPIYDALYELLGVDEVTKLVQQDTIEIAPLAFMRGRTLSDSFILVDEAQNTTITQMKMLLTRIGFGSQMVVTGDMTQTDLPKGTQSGLSHAVKLMKDFKEVGLTVFSTEDVVRHSLVGKIIKAYERQDNK